VEVRTVQEIEELIWNNLDAACNTQIEQDLSSFEVTSAIALPVAGSPRHKPQDNQTLL
jgi:hypothetical protein